MAIALIVAALLLFVFALAVRLAGANHILNVVRYDTVADPAALHAWVCNRLVALAVLTTGLAIVAFRSQAVALFCLLPFVVAVFAFSAWLMVGAGRFTAASRHGSAHPKEAHSRRRRGEL